MALNSNGLDRIASIHPAPLVHSKVYAETEVVTDEKRASPEDENGKSSSSDHDLNQAIVPDLFGDELDNPDKIIKSGADAAQYMLSDRDDGDPAVTVRSMVLGTAFAAFYASISQIYMVRPSLK